MGNPNARLRDPYPYQQNLSGLRSLELVLNNQMYIVTLPFKINYYDMHHWRTLVKVIEQTKKKWSWFTQAQRWDEEDRNRIRLGTLIYLLFEVRQQIYNYVSSKDFDDAFDRDGTLKPYRPYWTKEGWVEYTGTHRAMDDLHDGRLRYRNHYEVGIRGNIFDAMAYLPYYRRDNDPRSSSRDLRDTCTSLRDEFDLFYFTTYTFEFRCPRTLTVFLSRISTLQKETIRNVILVPWTLSKGCAKQACTDDWASACQELASCAVNLRSIKLGVGEAIQQWISKSGKMVWSPRLDGQWKQRLAIKIQEIERAINLPEKIGKQILQHLPNVNLFMLDEIYFVKEDRNMLHRMLAGINKDAAQTSIRSEP